jgi:hypothetical protein
LHLLLRLVDDELVGPKVVGQFAIDQGLRLSCKNLDFLGKRISQGLKLTVDILDDSFLSHFFLDKDFLKLVDLIIGVNFCQISEFIDKLRRMNVKMLGPTLFADESLGAFGIDAHVLAYLLVDLAL